VAVLCKGRIVVCRQKGKIAALTKAVKHKPLTGSLGISHTRWATHGVPSKRNAHPHTSASGSIAVVHNGIIENYEQLKERLVKEGYKFTSDTDTEVIPHLIEKFYKDDLEAAVRAAVKRLRGSFAIAVISKQQPSKLIAARVGSPLVLGAGKEENYIASDIPALLAYTQSIVFLEDNEMAVLTKENIRISTFDGKPITRKPVKIRWDLSQAQKCGYPHFMLKEIEEQPSVIESILQHRISRKGDSIYFEELAITETTLCSINKISIVACGTAYHAGLTARYIFEQLVGLPVEVDVSSEFRYRRPVLDKKTLVIAITQSGETADTLASIREARSKGAHILSIVNVLGSTITRESHGVIYTHAGPEIGVASTKAYTAQLCVLYLFGLHLAALRKSISTQRRQNLLLALLKLPQSATAVLSAPKTIEKICRQHFDKTCFLYLGRHLNFPNALEGALKLKEISYVHAEGYGAGEMKHGPIALIDKTMPVVCIATESFIYEKMVSNIQEIKARGGIVISVATEGDKHIQHHSDYVVYVPKTEELFYPVLTVLPLQLIAYHIAVKNKRDVDQPRNLAKSVTVE
jgi:glucosamine--fructose-6-phosphate aminotransferase (isomerizing)